ncbi:hypothetical protein FHW75_005302 [Pseudomonas sp. OG7]|nr:hypothetical protein [Pseudomonas sp. OG7]
MTGVNTKATPEVLRLTFSKLPLLEARMPLGLLQCQATKHKL